MLTALFQKYGNLQSSPFIFILTQNTHALLHIYRYFEFNIFPTLLTFSSFILFSFLFSLLAKPVFYKLQWKCKKTPDFFFFFFLLFGCIELLSNTMLYIILQWHRL